MAHKAALVREMACVDVMLLDFADAPAQARWAVALNPEAFLDSTPKAEPAKPAPVGVTAQRLAIAQFEGDDGDNFNTGYIEEAWRNKCVTSPSRGVTNTLLSEWTKKGYLKRVEPGVYTRGPKAP